MPEPVDGTAGRLRAHNPCAYAGGAFGYIALPMPVFLRSLLVWLMVLAIPNQGLAVSVMRHCAPAPVHAGVIAAEAADGHGHMHAAERPGQVAGDVAHGPVHLGAVGANLPQDTAGDGAGTCSVCAACCLAVGMPPSPGAIPQPPGAAQAPPPGASDLESFVPGGLDRPPRTPQA